jgi:hypothetical protein
MHTLSINCAFQMEQEVKHSIVGLIIPVKIIAIKIIINNNQTLISYDIKTIFQNQANDEFVAENKVFFDILEKDLLDYYEKSLTPNIFYNDLVTCPGCGRKIPEDCVQDSVTMLEFCNHDCADAYEYNEILASLR